MHDLQLADLRGWPDLTTAASLTVVVKQSVQLSNPLPGNGNWDCVVQMNPVLDSHAIQLRGRENDRVDYSASTSQRFGMVTAKSYSPSGVNFGLGTVPNNDIVVGLPPRYSKGRGRLIGLGFEVNNTTAELNKQGTATVYRLPQTDMDSKTYRMILPNTLAVPDIPTAFSGQNVAYQPQSIAEAMLLPGSRQWQAKDGAYVVAGFNDSENLVVPVEYRQPVVFPCDIDDLTNSLNSVAIACPSPSTGQSSTASFPGHKWAPINTGGCIFTGLSDTTTLTLTVNAIYEAFPTPAEPEYVVLAKPSAEFDPLAMAMVTRAMESMPVGVPAYDNGFGDWFAGLVSEFAPSIGNALGTMIPGAGFMGTGAKFLADRYLATNSANLNRPPMIKAKKERASAKNSFIGPQVKPAGYVEQGSKQRPFKVSAQTPPKWWKGEVKAGKRAVHDGKHYVLS